MEMDIPALAFLATTLAIGGACLGYVKRKYHTTDHHLLIFALIGAVGYLAPKQMRREADQVSDRLKVVWLGSARLYGHGLEREGDPATIDEKRLAAVLGRVSNRLGAVTGDCVAATLYTAQPGSARRQLRALLPGVHSVASIGEPSAMKIEAAFGGAESWYESTEKKPSSPRLFATIPVLGPQDAVLGVLAVEFSGQRWDLERAHTEWRVAAEFLGLQTICLVLGGILVARFEARKKDDLEKATRPLMAELESLDGMVNAVQGVVWERTSGAGPFRIVSQLADGYLGYDMDRWLDEKGFLASVIHAGDLQRVRARWAEVEEKAGAYHLEYHVVRKDGGTAMVTEHGVATRDTMSGLVLRGIIVDVTAQREAEAEQQDMHKMMIEASRQAGMAEIATGVLHNVGNVLNSLNVGAKLLAERLKRSRLDKLSQAAALLKDNLPHNTAFFTDDKRGLALPGYLVELATYLNEEQNRLGASVGDMIERIEHIRDMIMLQQSHSSVRTLWESLDLATVMEDALRLEMDVHLAHQQVRVVRHFADMPPVYLARGLLLQILVNLFANACQAMSDKPADERVLTLRISPQPGDRVRLVVEDTGCGIQPRHLTNIFKQGFTTKRDGHGFGLHHACLLAQDMSGSLSAESDGLGKGARFILDLPARKAPGVGATGTGPLPPPPASTSTVTPSTP